MKCYVEIDHDTNIIKLFLFAFWIITFECEWPWKTFFLLFLIQLPQSNEVMCFPSICPFVKCQALKWLASPIFLKNVYDEVHRVLDFSVIKNGLNNIVLYRLQEKKVLQIYLLLSFKIVGGILFSFTLY